MNEIYLFEKENLPIILSNIKEHTAIKNEMNLN